MAAAEAQQDPGLMAPDGFALLGTLTPEFCSITSSEP